MFWMERASVAGFLQSKTIWIYLTFILKYVITRDSHNQKWKYSWHFKALPVKTDEEG